MAKRGAKAAPGSATSSTRTILELAEDAEDRFDEACEHARQAPVHAGLRLGPSLSVPMARLRAGRLAWTREVHGAGGRAELCYVLDPVPAVGRNAPGELPLLDLASSEVLADERAGPGSPVRLLGIGEVGRAPKQFASFFRAVRAELLSDRE
jgi:hypothetical protein